ncbi:MAG: carboxymuconolactone decarboxylase family protein [Gemmatimonadetes bacterium]|nr:carboxymuconolactone decarboxylase family protein [Gemmatimonadota bacterium]
MRKIEAMRTAAEVASPGAVEEALLQSYLFLGFPAALTALAEWRELSGGRALPEPEPMDLEDWRRRGEEVCRTVYGRAYDKLRASVRRVHPAMDAWMIQEGYGKVLAREGLDLKSRELCIVSILSATGWEPQLHSHLRGALHAGCDEASVEYAVEAGLEFTDSGVWREAARHLWSRVRERSPARSGGRES